MALARLEIVNVACWRENQAVASHQAKATQADSRTRTHAHKQQSSIFEVAAGASAGAGAGAAVWLWGEAGSEGTGRGRRRVADRHLVHTHTRTFAWRIRTPACLSCRTNSTRRVRPTRPAKYLKGTAAYGLAPSTNRPDSGYSLTDSVLSIGFGGCSCVWIESIAAAVVTSIIEATNGERHGWCLEEGFGWLQWLHGRLVIVIDRRDYYDGGASSRPPFLNSAKNSCGSIG